MIEGVGARVRAPAEGPCSSIAGEIAWTEILVDELAKCVTPPWLATSEDEDMDGYTRTTDEALSLSATFCQTADCGRPRLNNSYSTGYSTFPASSAFECRIWFCLAKLDKT